MKAVIGLAGGAGSRAVCGKQARIAIGKGPKQAADHIHSFADLPRRMAIRWASAMHTRVTVMSPTNAAADMKLSRVGPDECRMAEPDREGVECA